MKSYLQIENLTKSFGDRLLFADVTFGINQGDKIGLIAKNGTGKTTLLRIIAGKESPDSGTVTFRNDLKVGIVSQSPEFEKGMTVMEACMTPDTPMAAVTAAYEEALASGNQGAIEKAMAKMDAADAWTYDDRLRQILTRLNITDLNAQVDKLSGGQQKRIAIARVILEEPDLIILDEPTNHLDIDVIEWLEGYLTKQNVTLLMVTHDRYFLDRVCNKIIEIDMQQTFTYDGNYDYYLRRRAERIEALSAEMAKVKNTLRKEQEWMRRQPQARASKAQYRIDAFYKLQERSRNVRTERDVHIATRASYIGSKIFEAEDIAKRFGDKVILKNFTYTFARHERVGIIGPNGAGKTTFIRMLMGLEPTDSGHWNLGETVRFGYYNQLGINFDNNKKVIDAVTEIAEQVRLDDHTTLSPMQFLNHFLFTPADQQKYIYTLSGGEKARLHLAVTLMRRPNFLILDEPTNDLDIVTLGILEEYLETFSGCLIVVSHDRFFLDNIVDHLFVMEGDGTVKDFPGNYSEYRKWSDEKKRVEAKQKEADAEPQTAAKPRTEKPRKLTFKERRELDSLTEEIDRLTEEKKAIEAKFSSGETIADVADLSRRYNELTEELDIKELRWLELSELA
ncbi:MAG: ABC-F family ATP-binding cassette domain-containing protein [Bacteroides sp.]|nr:ABC-F family ATP-binding cassette domain-containing protein [Bacteroides sp.]